MSVPLTTRCASGAPERIITLLAALATHFGVVEEVAAALIFTVEGHGKGPWDDIAGTLRQRPCFDNNGMTLVLVKKSTYAAKYRLPS